jgi:hypothetical protein
MPKSRTSVCWRVETLPAWNIMLTRAAEDSPVGTLMSAVVRPNALVVPETVSSVDLLSVGFFRTWLMTPPVEPRPNSIDDGPISTSICSRANVSR